jgi:phosphohistidine phosphatase
MLLLHLIRHAKASAQDYFPGDFYRTLEKTGYDEAQAMASWFEGQKNHPVLLMSSPAIRAFTTCLIFADKLSYPHSRIVIAGSIYEAPYTKLLRVIHEQDSSMKSIAMFGHNPGLTDLVNYLCGPVLGNIPTAGIITLGFEVEQWQDVTANKGKIIASGKP